VVKRRTNGDASKLQKGSGIQWTYGSYSLITFVVRLVLVVWRLKLGCLDEPTENSKCLGSISRSEKGFRPKFGSFWYGARAAETELGVRECLLRLMGEKRPLLGYI
jgi:hypothetical protein